VSSRDSWLRIAGHEPVPKQLVLKPPSEYWVRFHIRPEFTEPELVEVFGFLSLKLWAERLAPALLA
jgi:hypothetical protein